MNAPFLRPMGCPPGIEPAKWREVVELRIEHLQQRAARLIAALDAMDGDCDLEGNADGEPWLGWAEGRSHLLDYGDDREAENEHDEDDGTDEPDLGAPEQWPDYLVRINERWAYCQPNQERWAKGGKRDLEEVDEDGGDVSDEPHDPQPEGDDCDDEPALGWTLHVDQRMDLPALARLRRRVGNLVKPRDRHP